MEDNMTEKKSFVKDYMTRNVISVSPETTTTEIIRLMKESDHNSYPVVENNKLVGMVTAFDVVIKDWAEKVKDIMSTKLVVANEDLSINDASRVMFRRGISRMPVVDENGKLVGIITNTDMVRSHIERSTPNKEDEELPVSGKSEYATGIDFERVLEALSVIHRDRRAHV